MAMVAVAAMVVGTVISAVGAVRSAQVRRQASLYQSEHPTRRKQPTTSRSCAQHPVAALPLQRRLAEARLAHSSRQPLRCNPPLPTGLAQSARDATLDNLTIKYNAKMRAMGYQMQSNLDSANASNSASAGVLAGTSSLLSGAARAYGMSAGGGMGTGTPSLG